jgi:DNA-binding MarR family transcriptional regulator
MVIMRRVPESKDVRPTRTTDELELANRVHAAAIHLLRALRKQDDRSRLTAPRLSALSVLVFHGPTRLTDLAAAEQVRPPTMTRIVAGLEREGLVHRVVDSRDRRAVLLTATTKGTRLLHVARRRRVAALAAAMTTLDRAQRATLRAATTAIEAIVGAIRRAQA